MTQYDKASWLPNVQLYQQEQTNKLQTKLTYKCNTTETQLNWTESEFHREKFTAEKIHFIFEFKLRGDRN